MATCPGTPPQRHRQTSPSTPPQRLRKTLLDDDDYLPPPAPRSPQPDEQEPLLRALHSKSMKKIKAALVKDPVAARTWSMDEVCQMPLCFAVNRGCSVEIVQELLACGASPEAGNKDGRTPMYILSEAEDQKQSVRQMCNLVPFDPEDKLSDGDVRRLEFLADPEMQAELQAQSEANKQAMRCLELEAHAMKDVDGIGWSSLVPHGRERKLERKQWAHMQKLRRIMDQDSMIQRQRKVLRAEGYALSVGLILLQAGARPERKDVECARMSGFKRLVNLWLNWPEGQLKMALASSTGKCQKHHLCSLPNALIARIFEMLFL